MSGWLRFEGTPGSGTVLDGRSAPTAEAFHTAAATAFGFPDWYGRNWDAFEELLADVREPLIVGHAETLLVDQPSALTTLVAILRARAVPVTLTVAPGAEERCRAHWRAAGVVDADVV